MNEQNTEDDDDVSHTTTKSGDEDESNTSHKSDLRRAGVTYLADKNIWRARARINGIREHVGYFESEEAATIAITEFEKRKTTERLEKSTYLRKRLRRKGTSSSSTNEEHAFKKPDPFSCSPSKHNQQQEKQHAQSIPQIMNVKHFSNQEQLITVSYPELFHHHQQQQQQQQQKLLLQHQLELLHRMQIHNGIVPQPKMSFERLMQLSHDNFLQFSQSSQASWDYIRRRLSDSE